MSLLPNFFSVLDELHVVPEDSAYFGFIEEEKYEDTHLTHLSEFQLENILDSRGGNLFNVTKHSIQQLFIMYGRLACTTIHVPITCYWL